MAEESSKKKCEHHDRGYCKYKDKCPKVHPNANCEGTCGDKRTCMKRHKVNCKNGPTCEWNSCEFLHSEEHLEKESADIKTLKKDIEHKLNNIESQIIKSNEYHKAHTEAIVDNIMKVVNEKLEVIEEEYSSKLEQLEKACHKAMTKAEKNKLKVTDLENQIEQLSSQLIKSVEPENTTNPTEKINENKKDMTECRSKTNTEYKCEKCDKKFKSVTNLNIHIKKFHENQELNRCTYCELLFPSEKLLKMHVIAVHKNESKKHMIEREPSLANHKQKKLIF